MLLSRFLHTGRPTTPSAFANLVSPSLDTSQNTLNPLRVIALQLSATPFVKATGSVEGHLIPTLNLGISAFDNKVQSQVYIALDSAAVLNISLEEVVTTQNLSSRHDPLDLEYDHSTDIGTVQPRSVTAFDGCFEVDAALDFNAGADADFFHFIHADDQQWTIFQQTFPLYKVIISLNAYVI